MAKATKGAEGVQDMPMADMLLPSFAPTEEAQDVSTLAQIVVPVPAFTDPENPTAAQSSVNMVLETSPFPHDAEFGAGVETGVDSPMSTIDTHAKEQADLVEAPAAAESAPALPEGDREEWSKADWQQAAKAYGLGTSGNTDAIATRVEDHEEQLETVKNWSAGEWQDAVNEADDTDELAELRQQYDNSGASFKTVADAFASKEAELSE
jgi:hypothetical protein